VEAKVMKSKASARIGLVLAVVAVMVAGSMVAVSRDTGQAKALGPGGKYGGTVNIALNTKVTALDPKTATDDNTWKVLYKIYDTLMVIDNTDGSLKPWLIKDQPVWNAGSLTLTVTLKDSIKFHDKNTMTANDVKSSFTSMKPNTRFKPALDHVTTISTSGSNIFFTLDIPYAPIYYDALAKVPIMPSASSSVPIGSGPFQYVSKDSNSIKLSKFDDYFYTPVCGGPYVDGLVFKFYTGSDATQVALNDTAAGNLDYVSWKLRTDELKKGVPVALSPSTGFYYMAFNVKNPPLNRTDLKHAIAMCIDKKTILLKSFANFGVLGSAAVNNGNSLWFNGSVQNDYVKMYDANKDGKTDDADVPIVLAPVRDYLTSKRFLDVDGDGRRELPGSTYPGNVTHFDVAVIGPTPALSPNEDNAISSVASWMQMVGIDTRFTTFDDYSVRDTAEKTNNFDILFNYYTPSSPDPNYLSDLFSTTGASNHFGYSNSDVDKLLSDASKEMVISKRQKDVKDVQAILAVDLPASIVYYPMVIEAKSGAYTGWSPMIGGIDNIWSFLNIQKPIIGALDLQLDAPTVVSGGSTSGISLVVKSGADPIPNATVDIDITDGALAPAGGLTDKNGAWSSDFKAPGVSQATTVTMTVTVTATQYTGTTEVVYITVNPSFQKFKVGIELVNSTALKSEEKGKVKVTVKPTGGNGTAVPGAKVSLKILYLTTTDATLTPSEAATDSKGEAVFEFSAKVQTSMLFTLQATVTKTNWTLDDQHPGEDVLKVSVEPIPVDGGGSIPAIDTVGIVAAVFIAFGIVTVASKRRKRN
jgi:ABC-type transport system substrate-binding protein